MTKLTINIPDEVARGLKAEATLRHLSVEQIAVERVASKLPRFSPTPARPPLRTDNPEAIIGSFADRPDLLEAIQNIIDDRSRRYAGPQ